MGKLIPLARFRSHSVAVTEPPSLATSERDADLALLPIAVLLFVASVARVMRAWWSHEPFDVEPTLALAIVVALPWLAVRFRRKTS